jgi:hypothetical protein
VAIGYGAANGGRAVRQRPGSGETLLELQKTTHPAAVRLGAARSILEIGIKVRKAADLEQRVCTMEPQAALASLAAAGNR